MMLKRTATARELVSHIRRLVQLETIFERDAQTLCGFVVLCPESIVRAKACEDGAAIGFMVKHEPTSNPPIANMRLLDTLGFAAVLLLCLPGGRILAFTFIGSWVPRENRTDWACGAMVIVRVSPSPSGMVSFRSIAFARTSTGMRRT